MSLHTVFSVDDSSRRARPLPLGRSTRHEKLVQGQPTARGWIGYAVRMIALWADRANQRQDLAELDDRLLRDIGKSREEARCESSKPFWMP